MIFPLISAKILQYLKRLIMVCAIRLEILWITLQLPFDLMSILLSDTIFPPGKNMLITHNREKLINAIIYFSQNTSFCHKTKLFKLLYFLDFQHYKATGRSVTGLLYSAWKMGPVPTTLFEEIEAPSPDLASALNLETEGGEYPKLLIKPLADFNQSIFSKREMHLLSTLSSEYKEAKGVDMVEATHLENAPWDRVFNKERKPQAVIPYEYALATSEKDEMMSYIKERSDFLEAMH
jgi:uncharacterized phage-associated protein